MFSLFLVDICFSNFVINCHLMNSLVNRCAGKIGTTTPTSPTVLFYTCIHEREAFVLKKTTEDEQTNNK